MTTHVIAYKDVRVGWADFLRILICYKILAHDNLYATLCSSPC